MIRLTEILKTELPKKKWVKLSGAELDSYKEAILKLIQNAYAPIGGHPNYNHSSDISTKDAQAWELIDIDSDPDPDAVSVTKKKRAGTKFVGTGHDGTKDAKRAVIKHKVILLKKKGYFIEVSGRMMDIMIGSGIAPVKDLETVKAVLKGKDIKWLEGGKYQRKIGGKVYTKMMFGNPNA